MTKPILDKQKLSLQELIDWSDGKHFGAGGCITDTNDREQTDNNFREFLQRRYNDENN